MIVVHDGPDYTSLYLRAGTSIKRRVGEDGKPLPRSLSYGERLALPHLVGDGTWARTHALILFRDGEANDVRLFWSEEWEFRSWYVNLQRPVVRTRFGFDTSDHVLDVSVSPDLSWRWKDEDEFAEAIALGRFTVHEGEQIRAEGERVIDDIEHRRWPFSEPFIDWRPPVDWEMPALPDDWNE
jgi:hypothetical protein